MSDFTARVTAELDTSKLESQMQSLQNQDHKIKVNVDTGNSAKNINDVNKNVNTVQKSAQSMGNTLKKSLQIGSAATVAATAMREINKAAQEAVESIKEIDEAITNLRLATGESYDTIAGLMTQYNELGKSIGASTTEVAESADAWLRQGHTIEETNTLIRDSMILSKVSSLQSAEATEYLTTIMKNYGVAIEDVISIVDKLTSVDLVSATDAGGLAEAMSRTATVADEVGVSMDELIGYSAVLGEMAGKDMSSVGEALKTIFTRMGAIKAENLTLVDDDGTVEYLSDIEASLAEVGIDLRSTMSEYNDYSDILSALADKWDTLSDSQRNALSQGIGGTRHGNIFRILMENYETAESYMSTAAESAGTAEEKFGAYLDSIEAKTKTLQAAFESLAVNTFSTEAVGGIVDASAAVLEFLDNTNLLKGSLTGIATVGAIKGFSIMASGISSAAIKMNEFNSALSLLKNGNIGAAEIEKLAAMTSNLSNSQLKAVLSSKALTAEQKVAILTSQGMSTAEAKATLSTMGLATAEGTATVATFSLSGAFKGLWATLMANPLVLVVAGVTAASAYSTCKQKAEEAAQATLDAGESAKEASNNLLDLYETYEKAKLTKDGLTEATEALLSALGVEETEIDTLVEKYGNLDEAIQKVTIDSLETKLSELIAGYGVASDKLLEATKDGWFSSFNMLNFSHGKNGQIFADTLKNAGLIDSGSYGSAGGGIYLGDNSTVEGVIAMYNKLTEMQKVLTEGMGDDSYNLDELEASDLYKGISEKITLFKDEYENVMEYINQINETSAMIQLQEALQENIPKTAEEFEVFKKEMIKTAKESGKFTGSQEDIEQAIDNTCASLPELADFYTDVETAVEGVSESTETAQQSIVTLTNDVQTLVSKIQSVQDVLSSQSTGKSISLADFNSDELEDYRSALEYVNGTLQLNAEKVNEITQAKIEEQIAVNDTNKAYAQMEYLENAAAIEELRKKIKDKNFAEGESEDILNDSIAAYRAENEVLLDTINNYDLMSASLREAVSAYQNWLNAQNAAQSGDMFDSSIEAMQKIHDTLNDAESDSYGRIGNEDYKAAVDFVMPESVDHEDTETVNKYMSSIKDLFTYDEDGKRDGLDIAAFCEKAVDAGLMVLDEAGENYQIAGQTTMEDFADGLNLSLPLVQAMFGEMEEFGAEFSWADEAVKTMGDLGVAANELLSLDQFKDLAITLDVSDLATKEEKIASLDATLKEITDTRAKMEVDSSEYEYTNQILEYVLAQKQLINQPDVMTVDTSIVEGKIGEAIALLQEFQTAQDQLEVAKTLGVDTTQAQANLDAVTSKIQELDTNVTTTLSINPTSVDTISSTIGSLSCEMIVQAGVDESAVIGYQQSEHDAKGTVEWGNDTKAVDNYAAATKYANGQVKWYNETSLVKTRFYATGTISWTGSQNVNGTAHAIGTAYAGGNWGTAQGGTTLVGELGQEIVVDPHTGKWYTVGDNGAEFAKIPHGAIVFNHKQTESLLANGYAIGRATALATGTAMVTGGISVSQANKPSQNASAKNSSSKKSSSSSSKSTSSSSKASSKDDFEETFDWVEIAITRIEEAIDRVSVKTDSIYKTYSKRNSDLSDEIELVSNQIDLQNQAYSEYMQQANSVGLSETWASKVRNGTIDVSTITDESLVDQIKEYQDFYEKAIEAKDAVAELHEEVASLYKDKFDNMASKYEGELALIEHLTNSYNNGMNLLEARGYVNSMKYYEALQKAEQQKQAALKKELNSLKNAYREAMASGEIEEGSEAWNEMQDAINGVKEELQKSSIELAEYAKQMCELDWSYFDLIQEQISGIISETEFLVDLLDGADLFDEKGNLTENGLATMGLHGQNYNIYMNQADQYGAEAAALDAEIEADPYNMDLIERRDELLELQRESILAAKEEKQAIVSIEE